MQINEMSLEAPVWKSVMVTRHLPEELSGLEKLCKNLWWCWNDSAKALFKAVDSDLWHKSGHNPMVILDSVSLKRYKQLASDSKFLSQMQDVMREFDEYMALKSKRVEPSVAYFCMEYGLDTSLKIYSGGLGILAGDYLKESSDMNVNMVAVGLLYRYGYFNQRLTAQGNQVADYEPQDFLKIPAEPVIGEDGTWLTVKLDMPGRVLSARIWKVPVGRTDLYLLDTDFEANIPEDRQITYHLYGGDWENRLKQELLLGIGGVRTLRALGLTPSIFHYNEGHAAFAGLERLREYMQGKNLNFEQALELVRASGLFTTHTPVPAGHDSFDADMLGRYLGHYPQILGIDWDRLYSLGMMNPRNQGEKFSMSALAANLSQNVNGVSMLHGKVSQEIFSPMYPGYLPEELHVSYVTNGVHYPTWAAKMWKITHSKVFGEEFRTSHYNKECFNGIYNVSDEELWSTKKYVKGELIKSLRERLADPVMGSHYSPSQIVKILAGLDADVLTIGFARRFATYKRATLLFRDLDRLAAIVNNPKYPVRFIFAGKAHPADTQGQELIKQIVDISKQERFLGKIVFVPGYDITLAKRMVQGVDIWLNNPTRPLEASGTSGEKAAMNGTMHFSVLDGWWVEGYKAGAGWALPLEKTYDNTEYQNELDAATIYDIIEKEIVPVYYKKDKDCDFSRKWVGYIKNTVAKVASEFTTNRMLTDYCEKFYFPQYKRYLSLSENSNEKACIIAAWKKKMLEQWSGMEVLSYTQPDASYVLTQKKPLESEVRIRLGGLSPEDIGVEMLFTFFDKNGKLKIQEVSEFQLQSVEDGVACFKTSILPEKTGMYQVGTRIYAKNELLPHRQDFSLVKWL